MRPTATFAYRAYRAVSNAIVSSNVFKLFAVGAPLFYLIDIRLRKLCAGVALAGHIVLEQIAVFSSSHTLRSFPRPVVIAGVGYQAKGTRMRKVSFLVAPLKVIDTVICFACIEMIDIRKAERIVYKGHRDKSVDKKALREATFRQVDLFVPGPCIRAGSEFSRRKPNGSIARHAKQWEAVNGYFAPCFHHSILASKKEN